MENICKTFFQIYFITLLSIFILPLAVQSETQISGTVTAKGADSVKVEFKSHKTAGPKKGDKVDFKIMIQGMEVNAGQGEVTENESGFIWVKIKKGRPNLKMTALIHATGEPGPVEYTFAVKGSSNANEMYNIAAAELKVKLQAGLVFNSPPSTLFRSQFYLDDEEQVFGNIYLGKFGGQALTDSRPFLEEHKIYTQVLFRQGGGLSQKSDVIWENRMLTGAVSKCVASRAAVRIIINGQERFSHKFHATCRAAASPTKPHHIEPLFGFELSISFPKNKDPDGDYWEKQFFNAIRSLSIEFKE